MKMFSWMLPLLVLFAAALPTAQGLDDTAMRTWTRRNGGSFTAALVEAKGGVVVFQKQDGSKLQFPLLILSDPDQKYIKEQTSTAPPNQQVATETKAAIPDRWFEGIKGYEKAVELQKQTSTPMLVWITWHTCPYCQDVDSYLRKLKVKRALQGFIRVVIDERANDECATFCRGKGYSGGCFYVVSADQQKTVTRQWAWQGNSRIIVDDLEEVLASQLQQAAKK